jgi:hypothetical protein
MYVYMKNVFGTEHLTARRETSLETITVTYILLWRSSVV